MADAYVLLMLGLAGLMMGSFIGALVWRLHTKRNFVSERSQCESCGHTLAAKDLVPVLSWLALRGRCRYCGARISAIAPITECAIAALFVVSYMVWPLGFDVWQGVVLFMLWLVYIVMLGALVIYDIRWMLLPNKITFPLIGLSVIDAAIRVSMMPNASIFTYIMYIGGGIIALAGVYWFIYTLSKGRMVGFGDIKLSVFIGVVLGWQKAVLVLMLANVLAFFVVLPGLASGKLTRRSRVPFGPFLIAGFLIAGLWGDAIINWYISLFVYGL